MFYPVNDGYFEGSGGLLYGLGLAGITTARSLEYDKSCCATLRMNFDHEVRETDIRNELVLDNPMGDIMTFTYPCTKYSTIADIHGARTGDELFLHALRHVVLRRPEAFVLENVPGMMKFKVVMECFTKLPGYYFNVVCPVDAASWLPQRRERLIIIATRRRFTVSPPKPRLKVKLSDIIERGAHIEIPDYVKRRMAGHYRDLPIISDPAKGDIAPTCVAHYSKDLSTRMIKDGKRIRPYTVREYARLQGFPDSFKFAGTERNAYKQIGNAVAVPVGEWIGKQLIKYFN